MLGAIIGDIVGSVYEFNNIKTKDFDLYNPNAFYTDDTIMTLAVMEIIQEGYINDENKIIETIKKWGNAYPDSGYGTMFNKWLKEDKSSPYKSFGNGSAMRVSPIGFYANSEEEAEALAKKVTKITHNHKEGIKGAVVTAKCIYYAKIGKSKEFIKEYAIKEYKKIKDLDYETLKKKYTFNETCQDTVPEAIYCFLISNSFEDCLRTSVSIGGDTDTLCAISCAIAEAYYKYIDVELMMYAIRKLPEDINECEPNEVLRKYVKSSRVLFNTDYDGIDIEKLDKVIKYLESNPKIEWVGGEPVDGYPQMPYPNYPKEVLGLLSILEVDYNYARFEFYDCNIDGFGYEELRAYFTFVNRAERFSTGRIASDIEDGSLLKAAKKLKELVLKRH